MKKKKRKKMSKLLIIIGVLSLTSCISLKKQFIKKPVESAELCKMFYPTKEKESKDVVRYKTDTITIKGDSVECPIKTIVKDTIINGKSETKIVYVPTKVKCPDSKTIRDTIEIDKKVIIKDTTTEILLNDIESKLIESQYKIKDLENKLHKKNNHLFYIYLVISLYVGYNAVKFYIKNKTKI